MPRPSAFPPLGDRGDDRRLALVADASVRAARPGDAEQIAAVQLSTWRTAYGSVLPVDLPPTDDVAAAWRGAVTDPPGPGHHVLVALENEELVGFAALVPDEDDPGTGRVSALLVEPRWGRRGHGSRLLAAVVDHARGDGRRLLRTWVPERDDASTGFFESAGWERDGWVRTLDGDAATVREIGLHTSLAEVT